jgi:hypothetical protein
LQAGGHRFDPVHLHHGYTSFFAITDLHYILPTRWAAMLFENHIGVRGNGSYRKVRVDDDQATKGIRWMPWRQEAMKDVASCDKRREAAKQVLIRRFLNGETHPG